MHEDAKAMASMNNEPVLGPINVGPSPRSRHIDPNQDRTLLKIQEVCDYLSTPRSSWDKWRALGRTPPLIRLPNRQLRVHVDDLERWLLDRRESA